MLVSAHAFGGVPQRAISAVLGEAEACVTETPLEEYRDVPPRLFAEEKIQREQLESLVTGIAAFVAAARVVAGMTNRGRRAVASPSTDLITNLRELY